MEISREMKIAEVLETKEGAGKTLAAYGAHCIGCPQTGISTVESMAQEHDADVEKLLKELNSLPDRR